MKYRFGSTQLLGIALLSLLLGGCATYYPVGRDSGVYSEVPSYRSSRVVYTDPFLYPYWSLDYFYYSRYYHPYSVVVHRYDPWYYPYPGWYFGYRPGPRFSGHHGRYHYPWYRYGDRYSGYHPWHSGAYLSFGYYGYDRGYDYRNNRVRDLDARLRELETRRSLLVRSQRPDRQLAPGGAPWRPATAPGTTVRRGDAQAFPRGERGSDAFERARQRQVLIERLRARERSARLPERSERYRDRPPVAPPATRNARPRQPDIEPAPPSRQRSSTPTPPRSRPQSQPTREPAGPTRSQPRPRRDEPVQRERR